MERLEKGIQIIMWSVVVLMIVIFFASIIIGHATNYDFLFGLQGIDDLSKETVSNSNVLL